MALYTVTAGNQINAADLNQLVNLLNGTTTGLGVTLASTLSLGGSPGFIVDWGTFNHTYGGGQDNGTQAMNRNFNSRSGVIADLFLFNSNHGATDILAMSVDTTTNPATLHFQFNNGNSGTIYTCGFIAIG
jgi:hypothetical protein